VPEFFALDGGHVLIYSTMGKVIWQSGVLDVASMKFAPAKTGLLDLDAFYVPRHNWTRTAAEFSGMDSRAAV